MQVYVLCDKKTDKVVDVYSDMRAVRELCANNPKMYYCVEKTLLDVAPKLKTMIEVNEKVYEPKHYKSIMPFGKYKGQIIGDIIQSDPSYLLWCKDNLTFDLDDSCLELINYSLGKEK